MSAYSDHPELPGWRVRTQEFRYERRWGVAIEKGDGPERKRYAVLSAQGVLDRDNAIASVIPALKKYAGT